MSPLYQEREGRALDPIPAVGRLHALDPGLCIDHTPQKVIVKQEEEDGCGLFRFPDTRRIGEGQHRDLILGQSRRGEAVPNQYPRKETMTKSNLRLSPPILSPYSWHRVQCLSSRSKVQPFPNQDPGGVSSPLSKVQWWRTRRSSQRICGAMMKTAQL